MRVSQRSLFNSFVFNMNRGLTELMELNTQASSQKKINRPSDDAVGAARVLDYRDSLAQIDQFRENVGTAKGWLGLADQTMIQVSTVLTRCQELAQQASTGTLDEDNREQISYEVRQLFRQLMNLANTDFEGQHIFAGHKTDRAAFQESLWLTSNDANVESSTFTINGASERSLQVQFLTSGAVGGGALNYRYSDNAGRSWTNGTVAAGDNMLNLGGVQVTMENGTTVQAVDTANGSSENNGTWLWVRPTAIYMGDDEDGSQVDILGAGVAASADGAFSGDILVRIDNDTSLASNISYSYSMDGGLSFVTGQSVSDASTPNSASLLVPGGFLNLASNGSVTGNQLYSGDQFVIRPRKADLNVEIAPNEFLTINGVGKDIFGGVFQRGNASNAQVAMDGAPQNMFEAVGKLVGYIETNNQGGCQQALEGIEEAMEHIMTSAASVGGRENRLDVAENILETMKLSESERLSEVEDADVAELMTQLAQQQIVYESVLKSSSMIMRMNLTNYV